MNWKKFGKKFLFPTIWIIIILTIVSALSLIFLFINNLSKKPIAYPIYIVSFYTLIILCAFFIVIFPKQYTNIRQKIYKTSLGKRYMTDVEFKNHISLYFSLSISLFYAGLNLVLALLNHSTWFVTLGGYYIILAIMRFLLVSYIHKNKLGTKRLMELKCARICSVILITINIFLSGTVVMIIHHQRGFNFRGILIYIMAMYTFYMTISAIVDLIKYRKYRNPILSTSKVIKLAAALVSMLTLETAMFSQFGKEISEKNQRLMISLTGVGVSIIVISMAMYMIVCTTKAINQIRRYEIK